jgi:hypothetical protein
MNENGCVVGHFKKITFICPVCGKLRYVIRKKIHGKKWWESEFYFHCPSCATLEKIPLSSLMKSWHYRKKQLWIKNILRMGAVPPQIAFQQLKSELKLPDTITYNSYRLVLVFGRLPSHILWKKRVITNEDYLVAKMYYMYKLNSKGG